MQTLGGDFNFCTWAESSPSPHPSTLLHSGSSFSAADESISTGSGCEEREVTAGPGSERGQLQGGGELQGGEEEQPPVFLFPNLNFKA